MSAPRFHRSSMLAFPKTTDYACSLTVAHLSFWSIARHWLRSLFN